MKLKRILTLTLALMLLVSCMGITAFAENTEPWEDGATPPQTTRFSTRQRRNSNQDLQH